MAKLTKATRISLTIGLLKYSAHGEILYLSENNNNNNSYNRKIINIHDEETTQKIALQHSDARM